MFRELDLDYISSWGEDWKHTADPRLMVYWELEGESQTPEQRRIIILMQVLPDSYNIGYQKLANLAVHRVNGRTVDSVADLEEAFQHPEDGFHTVTFYPNQEWAEVVLDAGEFEEATKRVLAIYSIPERVRLEEDLPETP